MNGEKTFQRHSFLFHDENTLKKQEDTSSGSLQKRCALYRRTYYIIPFPLLHPHILWVFARNAF